MLAHDSTFINPDNDPQKESELPVSYFLGYFHLCPGLGLRLNIEFALNSSFPCVSKRFRRLSDAYCQHCNLQQPARLEIPESCRIASFTMESVLRRRLEALGYPNSSQFNAEGTVVLKLLTQTSNTLTTVIGLQGLPISLLRLLYCKKML